MSEENLKKLIFQSQYTSEEFNETNSKMDLYREQFYKEFPEYHEKMLESQKNSETNNNQNTEEEPVDSNIEEEHDSIKDTKKPLAKKLYRRISKITHPDKVESEFLTSYFKKATTAYSENNISELFTIASFLNIDISDIDKEKIVNDLKSDIFTKQFLISARKSSIAWLWANAKSEEEKDKLRKIIQKYDEQNH